ncbi:MAG: ABC transporter permease, partial [Solirubrobacteraceae bacterium]
LWGIVTIVAVIFVTFVLFRIFPTADPATLLAGKGATPQRIAYIRRELGLNHSWIVQFWYYLKGILFHFNLGYSYYTERSVLSEIGQAFPATLSLTAGAVVLWVIVGIPIGIISAIKRGTILDRVSMTGALTFVSMPTFWFALILIYLLAQSLGRLQILPGPGAYVGLTSNPAKWFTSLILPWFVLALTQAAIYSRLLRGNLLDVMGEDYIRTARAKGLRERRVVFKHGVRSAITPVLTVLGIDLGALLGGAVITETIFEIHGIGLLNITAIRNADFPVVQGTTVLAAMFVVLANIAVDILYAYVDPRVRYS